MAVRAKCISHFNWAVVNIASPVKSLEVCVEYMYGLRWASSQLEIFKNIVSEVLNRRLLSAFF